MKKLKIVLSVLAVIIFFFGYENYFCSGHSYGISCTGFLGGFMGDILTLMMWLVIFGALIFWIWVPILFIWIGIYIGKKKK